MRRRDFVSLIGGSAVVWPLVARAQQGERMRRVGVLESLSEDPYLAAFLQGLQQLGWADGHNVRIDTRWGAAMSTTFASTRLNCPRLPLTSC
ncbi:MAG: hypothetical protein WA694_20105 [Pseudolabrys sp.]